MSVTGYEVILADTEKAKRTHYQIRYHVYCLQAGYEDPESYPEALEKDSWDAYSAHFLVRSRQTREWVGALRLILPCAPSLPIAQRTRLEPALVGRKEATAELSRLCLIDGCSSADDATANGGAEECGAFRSAMKQRRRTGDILLSLLHASIAYSLDEGIDQWYFLTTPNLSRIVSKLIPFTMRQIGAPCWHRGERVPYLTSVREAAEGLGWGGDGYRQLGRWPAYRRYSDLVPARRANPAAIPLRASAV